MIRALNACCLVAILFCLAPLADAQTVKMSLADGFDFPVGKPNADGYYKSRGLRLRAPQHFGEDWNGRGGGASRTNLRGPTPAPRQREDGRDWIEFPGSSTSDPAALPCPAMRLPVLVVLLFRMAGLPRD